MFNGYTKGQALMMGRDRTKNPARDDNSFISNDVDGTPEEINFISQNISNWYPNISNYGYTLLSPFSTNNYDTKAFCTNYAGCFKSQEEIKYITDHEFLEWPSTLYYSPFLEKIDFADSTFELERESDLESEKKSENNSENNSENKFENNTKNKSENNTENENESDSESKSTSMVMIAVPIAVSLTAIGLVIFLIYAFKKKLLCFKKKYKKYFS